MGIDFGKLISNLGVNAASLQNDRSKIDTKTELNTYVSGWDAVRAKAEAENAQVKDKSDAVNIDALEAEMNSELSSLMGADFGKSAGVKTQGTEKEPFFSEEDISLENMMSLLSTEDGLDINKLREENKKPMLSDGAREISTMETFGFDSELTQILMETAPGAVKYISDAIKSGAAERIEKGITNSGQKVDLMADAGITNVLENMFKNDIA